MVWDEYMNLHSVLALAIVAQLLLVITVIVLARRVDKWVTIVEEHDKHLAALNALDKAQARQIRIIRDDYRVIRDDFCCHSEEWYSPTLNDHRGEIANGNGRHG